MEGAISKLPAEMLFTVLNLLDNEDKCRVMRVSKRWKEQIEENVLFYDVVLTDENYETVRERFGNRRVGSMIIHNYSRTENPFTNLAVLKKLKVSGAVPENALTAILADAVQLKNNRGLLLFYDVILTDENYESVRERFGHRRVISMSINNYSRTDIPFTNLDFLRELKISGSVRDNSLTSLFTNATNLEKVFVVAHIGCKPSSESLLLSSNQQQTFPVCVKRLDVRYKNYDDWPTQQRLGHWNTALDYGMPNVEELYFRSSTRNEPGLDFFWLLTSKPKLHSVDMKQLINTPRSEAVINPTPFDLQLQSLTEEMESSLSQVRLTSLRCNILKDHTRAWGIILSAQTNLQELVIRNGTRIGFQISMILPVLKRCSDTLSTIDLHIDPSVNSTIDIQIFSNLKFLRKLELQVYKTETWNASEDRYVENGSNIPTVENVSTIITKHLVYLRLTGFEFSEEDAINAIIIEWKRDLDMVVVYNEILSIWKGFERRFPEMHTIIISPDCISYSCNNPLFEHDEPSTKLQKSLLFKKKGFTLRTRNTYSGSYFLE
ncbi:unnamed protein product [Orchesella dallaii]|uniref:F-box domain-containing protein n=1 Tax=Orchesella dallaii TaxID=48710 RepID=A0ABP1RWI7_9HEXA